MSVNYDEGPTCEHTGHTWCDAGGDLEICALCEAERWAKDEDPLIIKGVLAAARAYHKAKR
jgi:hypothetical protein